MPKALRQKAQADILKHNPAFRTRTFLC